MVRLDQRTPPRPTLEVTVQHWLFQIAALIFALKILRPSNNLPGRSRSVYFATHKIEILRALVHPGGLLQTNEYCDAEQNGKAKKTTRKGKRGESLAHGVVRCRGSGRNRVIR